ncbi:NADP-dependent oxidoreductase [Subtercola sp. YIM 133946]|uniref:NADP-dependent oxidoreductase n=1 Tax=Subtercola sp. YIM 133946 TaxID=3118909 RepID=UPI002F936100
MTEQMRALRAERRGGPEQLTIDTIAVPSPGPGETLIEVHAAAITFAELTWDETWMHTPAIPGHEFSGVVADVADDVTDVSVGDEVFGLIRFELQGAAADYVVVPAADLARKPTRLSHAETAVLPLAALTAWQALFDVAHVSAGDRVLVHGGAGGVGIFAVQLARLAGATVTTTVRGDGVALASTLGADHIIDTDTADFTADFAAAGRRFDVVIDTIGGDTLHRSFDVIVEGGRLVTLQEPPDQARASSLGITATFFIVAPDVTELNYLAGLADRAELTVVLAATFPLGEGRAAFESGRGTHRPPGKTVLLVRP